MDYLFENLGPERFERFCHSLLSYEFPKFQCFPVGQPDGGRDAVAYSMSENTTKFVVFQVKFVRKPQTIVDPHKWLVEKLEEEVPKIQKLIPKGAKEYYLLTNVPGTAHPDSGSIDKVQAILFTGMIERVVVLVSRVQGTYEFEVQPLREYFAARHLFETAPYSPPGAEKRGTRPDRFDAIARNFYWLNVTRFYAGCYSKGELPSLVDRIAELIGEEGYR